VNFRDAMERVVDGFEIAGVAILVIGSIPAFVSAAGVLRSGDRRAAYERARQDVGRAILLGLEILIIADIVQTITVDQTFDSALTLGLIVLVRTFLSFSLEIELEESCPGAVVSRGSGPAVRATTRTIPQQRLAGDGERPTPLCASRPSDRISLTHGLLGQQDRDG
jgi:uncharacterized membrane protein